MEVAAESGFWETFELLKEAMIQRGIRPPIMNMGDVAERQGRVSDSEDTFG